MADKSSTEELQTPSPTQQPQETQYQDVCTHVDLKSSLSKREKWFIVILIALTAFFR
jgi:hypothetical protein